MRKSTKKCVKRYLFQGIVFMMAIRFFGCVQREGQMEVNSHNESMVPRPNIIYILAEDPSWPFFAEVK